MKQKKQYQQVALGLGLALIFSISSARGQDATFKLFHKNPDIPVGTTFDEVTSIKVDGLNMKADVGGLDISTKMTIVLDGKISTRVLEPGKLVSVIKEMTAKTTVETGGEEAVEEEPIPLVGKKLFTVKKDGKWKCSFVDGEATEEEQEMLEQTAIVGQRMEEGWSKLYGDKDHKVGDRLRSKASIYSLFGLADKDFRSQISLQIDRIEEYGGVRCAVLKGSISESGSMKEQEGIDKGNAVLNGKITIWRSIDYSEDMKMELNGTFGMSILASGMAMNGRGAPIKIVREIKVRDKK